MGGWGFVDDGDLCVWIWLGIMERATHFDGDFFGPHHEIIGNQAVSGERKSGSSNDKTV